MSRQFDHLSDIESFIVIVEKGSMSSAAIELNTTPSVLSRALTRLETKLGVQLLRRTTRHLSLTDAGQHYLEQTKQAFNLIASAEYAIQGQDRALTGLIRISVPTTYGHYRFPHFLPTFMKEYPNIQIELSISNRLVDLAAEGYDMAIRLGQLPDSNVVGQLLENAEVCLVAAPSYIASAGMPQSIGDLSQHACLPFLSPNSGRFYPWLLRDHGRDIDLIPPAALRITDDALGVVTLAEQGLGICQTYRFIIQEKLQRGILQEVLPEAGGRSRPFSLIYAAHKQKSAASRALINWLRQAVSTVNASAMSSAN